MDPLKAMDRKSHPISGLALNESGMSLTSVLVAVGIAGVLVVFVAQLFQQVQSLAFYANAQAELQDGVGTLALHLAQDSNCSCNFKDKTFTSTAGAVTLQRIPMTSLQTFDTTCLTPDPLISVGSQMKGVRHLTVNKLDLANLSPLGSVDPPTSYTADILIGFESGPSVFGIPPMVRKIPVEVTVTDPGGTATIQSCKVIGKGSASAMGPSANLTEFFAAMDGQKIGALFCHGDTNTYKCQDDANAAGVVFDFFADGLVVKVLAVRCNNNACYIHGSSFTFPKLTIPEIEAMTIPSMTRPPPSFPPTPSPTDYFELILDPTSAGVALKGYYERAVASMGVSADGCSPDSSKVEYASRVQDWTTSWVISPTRSTMLPTSPQAASLDSGPAIRALFPGVNLYLGTIYQTKISMPAPPTSCPGG